VENHMTLDFINWGWAHALERLQGQMKTPEHATFIHA